MKAAKLPNKDYLDECLDYNEDTGVFTWRNRPRSHFKSTRGCRIWNSRFSNTQAGSVKKTNNGKSYLKIGIDGKILFAHRLAIVFITGGIDVDMEVDHIDGDGLNNKKSNLRIVTRSENQKNLRKPSTNSSGAVGVCWSKKSKKWQAQIRKKGKQIHLGFFDSISSAIKARKIAEIELFYHKNHGTERPL